MTDEIPRGIDYFGFVNGDIKRALNYFDQTLVEQTLSNFNVMTLTDKHEFVNKFNAGQERVKSKVRLSLVGAE